MKERLHPGKGQKNLSLLSIIASAKNTRYRQLNTRTGNLQPTITICTCCVICQQSREYVRTPFRPLDDAVPANQCLQPTDLGHGRRQ